MASSSSRWEAQHGGVRGQGRLLPIDEYKRHDSLGLSETVVNQYKLELLCEEGHVDEVVDIIRHVGRAGQLHAGWVYVTDPYQALPIE